MIRTNLSLLPEDFDQIFPFHIAFGTDLQITQFGHSLARIAPDLAHDQPLAQFFRITQPHAIHTFSDIERQSSALFMLESTTAPLTLRGQILIQSAPAPMAVFLGSPWVTSLSELASIGLSSTDFAVHDPMVDLLTLLQSQQVALRDTNELARALESQRQRLLKTNQRLEYTLHEIANTDSALRASNTRLSTLITNMQSGILVEDQQRHIVLINQTFCDLFSIPVPPDDLIGSDCSQSAQLSMGLFYDPQGFVSSIDQILIERTPVVAEELAMADGRTLERDYIPIFLDEQYYGHLWQYRDITERKQSQAALAQARDVALESSQLKSEFLATVSHEIRTPMNGVIGMAELLLETPLNDEQREFVQIINESGHALLTIINDILDYSRIEAGKMVLDSVPTSLPTLIATVSRMFTARLQPMGIAMAAAIGPGVPEMVLADAGRLRQVLLNLLGNAAKFTERGSITIRVDIEQSSSRDCLVRFEVHDTGIGISAAAQQRLFQPFMQADGSVTRRYGGTGLGLAISKRLAELMGGQIGCTSEEGQGSIFWFTARLALEQPPQQPDEAVPTSQRHVLLVDDNPVNQHLAVRQLAKLGYTADTASSGREALDLLARQRERYCALLLDCYMPDIDGYEAARTLRAQEAGSSVHMPVIALTASTLQRDYQACIAAGMDAVLTKPLQPDELADALEQWRLKPQPVTAAPPSIDMAVIEPFRTLDPSGGILSTMVAMFYDEARLQIEAIRGALASGDTASIAQAAQQLQRSCAQVGACQLAEQAQQLQGWAQDGAVDQVAQGLPALVGEITLVQQQLLAMVQERAAFTA
ncbi:response regulator [Chloroflexia bacterium SDU3-3]|nr:response regulator [Chloroflexia bacterium SDU3-3]